jgi:hypothetical protein
LGRKRQSACLGEEKIGFAVIVNKIFLEAPQIGALFLFLHYGKSIGSNRNF